MPPSCAGGGVRRAAGRTFEMMFHDSGVRAYVFTFG